MVTVASWFSNSSIFSSFSEYISSLSFTFKLLISHSWSTSCCFSASKRLVIPAISSSIARFTFSSAMELVSERFFQLVISSFKLRASSSNCAFTSFWVSNSWRSSPVTSDAAVFILPSSFNSLVSFSSSTRRSSASIAFLPFSAKLTLSSSSKTSFFSFKTDSLSSSISSSKALFCSWNEFFTSSSFSSKDCLLSNASFSLLPTSSTSFAVFSRDEIFSKFVSSCAFQNFNCASLSSATELSFNILP